MKNQFKQEIGLGVLCGCAFALLAWGVDGYLLAKAHAALPWLKLAFGLPLCAATGGLAGWLTIKIPNLFLRFVIWLSVAVFFSYLTSLISFTILPFFLRYAFPQLSEQVIYQAPQAINARRFVTLIMSAVLLSIGGLIFESVSDSIRHSRGILGAVFSAISLLLFFAGAGYIADSNFNVDLRTPIIILHEKIEYIATTDIVKLDESEKRALRRFTKLDVNFQGPYRLMILTFDPYISQIMVGADFDGILAECAVLSGHASSCNRME